MQNIEIQAQVCLTDIRYYFFHVIIIFINKIHYKLPGKISNSGAPPVLKLHRPTANLSCFQQSTLFVHITIIKILPSRLMNMMNEKAKLKTTLTATHYKSDKTHSFSTGLKYFHITI